MSSCVHGTTGAGHSAGRCLAPLRSFGRIRRDTLRTGFDFCDLGLLRADGRAGRQITDLPRARTGWNCRERGEDGSAVAANRSTIGVIRDLSPGRQITDLPRARRGWKRCERGEGGGASAANRCTIGPIRDRSPGRHITDLPRARRGWKRSERGGMEVPSAWRGWRCGCSRQIHDRTDPRAKM